MKSDIAEAQQIIVDFDQTMSTTEIDVGTKVDTASLEEAKVSSEKLLKDLQPIFETIGKLGEQAINKIKNAVSGGMGAYGSYTSAMNALRSEISKTGSNFNDARHFIDKFTRDGLVSSIEAAEGLKNLLAGGLSLDQASVLMERFKDAAVSGKKESVSIGQAVLSATEGVKNSNSALLQSIGVTTDLSAIQAANAQSMGETTNELAEAGKVQSIYLSLLDATKDTVGHAAKYTEDYVSAQAQLKNNTGELASAFGEALAPAVTGLLTVVDKVIEVLTAFIQNNQANVSIFSIHRILLYFSFELVNQKNL